jgi:hypothetical protein
MANQQRRILYLYGSMRGFCLLSAALNRQIITVLDLEKSDSLSTANIQAATNAILRTERAYRPGVDGPTIPHKLTPKIICNRGVEVAAKEAQRSSLEFNEIPQDISESLTKLTLNIADGRIIFLEKPGNIIQADLRRIGTGDGSESLPLTVAALMLGGCDAPSMTLADILQGNRRSQYGQDLL